MPEPSQTPLSFGDDATFRMPPDAVKPPAASLDATLDETGDDPPSGAATIRPLPGAKPAPALDSTIDETDDDSYGVAAARLATAANPAPALAATIDENGADASAGVIPMTGPAPAFAATLDEAEEPPPPQPGDLASTLDDDAASAGAVTAFAAGPGFVDIYKTLVEEEEALPGAPGGEEPSIVSTLVGHAAAGHIPAGPGDLYTPSAVRAEWGSFAERPDGSEGRGVTIHVADAEAKRTAEASITLRPGTMSTSAQPAQIGDYVLTKAIGVGGMGAVFRAKQTSLNRNVAVKLIRPENVQSDRVRNKFIAEAVLTGALDHPNIIPIHELGVTADAGVFYAMKEVKGRSWSSVMREKSEAENLDILLRVGDAVAFAHDRGVVHRDLKPENVMLGDFGEVLVMDWGISLPYRPLTDGTRIPAGRAGTPAYMAPEMARADTDRIGPASDIYLLGAILYELATGVLPHTGDNLYTCIASAANNDIEPCERSGELVDIARKAMAAKPEDRYPTVQKFQEAVREYLRHQESVTLSTRADENIEAALAQPEGNYDRFNQAIFGYSEALALWPDNNPARKGVRNARLALAARAHGRGDFDLAIGAVIPLAGDREAEDLRRKAERSKAENEARAQRIRRLWRIAAALVATVLAVLGIATFLVQRQYRRAEAERVRAVSQEQLAKANEARAVQSEAATAAALVETEEQRSLAVANAEEATRQDKLARANAEEARRQEERAVAEAESARKAQAAAEEQRKIALTQEQLAKANEARAVQSEAATAAALVETEKQRSLAVANAEEATRQEKLARANAEEARRQEKLARANAEEAKRQEERAVAEAESARKAQAAAEEQRKIALEALANEKVANEKALAEQQAKLAALERQREEEEKRKLAEAETARRIEELARAGQLEDSSGWALTPDEAVAKQDQAARSADLPSPDSVIPLPDGSSLAFRLIPPGEFVMGSPVLEKGRRTDEYLHPVAIEHPFRMAVTELTRGQWRAVVPQEDEDEFTDDQLLSLIQSEDEAAPPWRWRTLPIPAEEAVLPATGISPKDIRTKLLPALAGLAPAGLVIRLPTEAEWEYAARAGNPARFHSGDDEEDALRAGWLVYNSEALVHAVGQLEGNAWHLRDLVGNAYELTADAYDSEAYRRLPSANPWCRPEVWDTACYSVRGGSMESDYGFSRSAARNNVFWDNRSGVVGVRLVVGWPLEGGN